MQHCVTSLPPVVPVSTLVYDPSIVADADSNYGINLPVDLPLSTFIIDPSLTTTTVVCPTLNDLIVNQTDITTTSIDTNPTNNVDTVTSIV